MNNIIFHNITICCEGKHFPTHLRKPWYMTWQKLVHFKKLLIVLKRKTDLVSYI